MTSENFNRILKNPSQLQLSDLPLLNAVIEKHPYFQAPRAIRLKSLKEQESYLYNRKLKETAAYTVDRGVLFDFITSKTFNVSENVNDNIHNEESTLTTNIEESTENLSPSISNENNSEDTSTSINPDISAEAIKMTTHEAEQIVDPFLFEEKTAKELPEQTSTPNSETPSEEKTTQGTETPSEEKIAQNIETPSESTIQSTVIPLNIEAPLPFQKGETHSFSEWLKLASLQPIEREEVKIEKPVAPKPKKKLIESSLIDNFIKNNPKISPVKKDSPTANLAVKNPVPTEDLMTETLAKVYLAQRNFKKAIQAYKILSLKNPEKSGLFADQIRAIEKLQNNKQ